MSTEDEPISSDSQNITEEEYWRYQREYWRVVAESEGFDCDEYRSPVVLRSGLLPYQCRPGTRFPYRLLVKRYALLGLHRYNMLEGTKIELAALQKFNKTMNHISSFYITFLAHDPAVTPMQKAFQVRVDEKEYYKMDLTVSIARPKKNQNEAAVTTKEPFVPHFHGDAGSDGVFQGELPDWPSDDTLNASSRFYVLKKSEWEANDWISLYLELLICSNDKGMFNVNGLSQVQIMKVAIETEEEDVMPLIAKCVHVYITFTGLAKPPRLVEGEHIVRQAIVRRVINLHSGFLTLKGKFWTGKDTELPSKMTGKDTELPSKKTGKDTKLPSKKRLRLG